MKRLLALLQILLILPVVAVAQDDAPAEVDIPEDIEVEDPGVTPDNFLWGADVAWDRIRLSFIRNKAERAKFRLLIAEERLAEIRAMELEDKFESLERAQGAYDATAQELEKDLEALEEEGDEENLLEEDIEIEVKFEAHLERLRAVRDKIAEKNEYAAERIDAAIEKQERVHALKVKRREKIKDRLLEERDDLTEAELDIEIQRLRAKYKEHIKEEGSNVDIRKEIRKNNEEFKIKIRQRIIKESGEVVRGEIEEELREGKIEIKRKVKRIVNGQEIEIGEGIESGNEDLDDLDDLDDSDDESNE